MPKSAWGRTIREKFSEEVVLGAVLGCEDLCVVGGSRKGNSSQMKRHKTPWHILGTRIYLVYLGYVMCRKRWKTTMRGRADNEGL
jgi:hypothetical protein